MLKSLLGFVKPNQGRMTVLDMDVRRGAARHPGADRLHARE
jgi:hypothetical protein